MFYVAEGQASGPAMRYNRPMSLIYDLHSHSTASDGTLTPTELVQAAQAAGVHVLSLTDHDTTEGIAEAQKAAKGKPITLVPGVEVSVTWSNQVVHIVGLGVDPHGESLQKGLQGLREFRSWRAQEIGRRLRRDAGIENAYEGAKSLSSGKLIGRTHFARYLAQIGIESNDRNVFKRYLVRGKPGHVPGQWAELDEAVCWIRDAGGQAVVAHPARYKMTRGKLRRLLGEFSEAGGVAMEVVSGSHSKDDIFSMAQLAESTGLLASAGSDFHGPENTWCELGGLPDLPETCRPVWHDWQETMIRHARLR